VLHEYGVTPGGLERCDGLDPVRDGKGRDEIIAADGTLYFCLKNLKESKGKAFHSLKELFLRW
jgi:hypothetical protein